MPEVNLKAMILAAGLGSRLKPFTDKHPKALALVNGKALLQRNIEYLHSFGVSDFVVNVHHFADQIIAFLNSNNNFGCNITISHEKEEALETGGGIKNAGWFFEKDNAPFIVMNVDLLTNLDIVRMVAYHRKNQPLVTLAVTNRKTSRNFLFDDEQVLCGWINNKTGERRISKPAHEPLHEGAFSCVHIIEPPALRFMKEEGKFSIIDAYLELARKYFLQGYEHSNDIVVDVGKPESIAEAEKYFR